MPFVNSSSRATKPFDLVHFDLWGASFVPSVTSARYFLLFIDFSVIYHDNLLRSTWDDAIKGKNSPDFFLPLRGVELQPKDSICS